VNDYRNLGRLRSWPHEDAATMNLLYPDNTIVKGALTTRWSWQHVITLYTKKRMIALHKKNDHRRNYFLVNWKFKDTIE
jgi:hypothetical protein